MEIKDTTTFQVLPRRQVIIAMVGTMLSMFQSALYMTVVATAMPRVITDLGGFSQYTWVFTAFIMAEVIAIPLSGKLSDMYGRKRLFIAGLVIAVISSFLSGISQTMSQLIIFRGIQGLGFGINMSLSLIVIGDIFPPAERGKWGGLMSAVMVLSTIIGPTLGGYLTDYLSWRWCFFINVPFGLIIILLFVFYFPHLKASSARHKVDYAGAVVMAMAILPLMLALTWGGVNYDWLSPTILGLLVFSLVMFALFIIIENRAREPILSFGLFKHRVVAVSSITVFLTGLSFMPAVTFIPLFYQGVLGASATVSGSFMVPMMLTSSVASFIAGQIISRTGGYYRLQATIGIILVAIGFFLLSRMTANTSFNTVLINIIFIGLGSGLIMPIHMLAVQNSVPYAVMGTTTSMVTWIRTIGGLFGLSLVGSVINNRFSSEFMGRLSTEIKSVVSPEKIASIVNNPQALVDADARIQLQGLFDGLGAQGPVLFEQMLLTLKNALSSALTGVFAVVAGLTILALIANLFLTGIPKHKSMKKIDIRGENPPGAEPPPG